MTTQPETAVGSEASVPAVDPFEAMAEDLLGADAVQEDEEDQPAEEAEPEGDEPDAEVDEEAADEDDDEPDLPAIDPPNSLTAEEKEQFKSLPREAQEFTARRIGELEKGFQTKAQEVAREKQALQLETLKVAEQIKAQSAEILQRYAQAFEVSPPDPDLIETNPREYAKQLKHYQQVQAQRANAQHDADRARAEQAQIQAARVEHEAEAFRQQLETELPEIFDPATGQQLAKELNATAELLGFDPNQISDVAAIKALKVTSEWKTKADKLDALNAKKMERVRSGKNPPPIAKPGTARLPEQNRKARADQAWQTALTSKSRSAKDEALADYLTNAGWL